MRPRSGFGTRAQTRATIRSSERSRTEWLKQSMEDLAQPNEPSRAGEFSTLPCMFGPLPAERFLIASEFEAQEKLGPRVVAVLTRRCCFKWSTTDILRYMNQQKMDPFDPETDQEMADMILRK